MSKEIVVGHNKHKSNLLRLIKSNKLPHALFFCGQSGIGKKLLGIELANYLFCENKNPDKLTACKECKSCKLFKSGNYPDYHFIDCKDKENFNTDAIKKTLYTLNLKSYEGNKRFILFESAEELRKEAANALLKILEEPPSNTYFCLIGSNTKSIPTTITSRCQVWYFKNLNTDELNEIAKRNELEKPDDFKNLLSLANGSMETLLRFLTEKELIAKLLSLTSDIIGGKQSKIDELINVIKENEELFLDFIKLYARKILRESSTEEDLRFWSNYLNQIMLVPELRTRNVNLSYVYNYILLELSNPNTDTNTFDIQRLVA